MEQKEEAKKERFLEVPATFKDDAARMVWVYRMWEYEIKKDYKKANEIRQMLIKWQ